jgi:WD40 repeat protein
MIERLISALRTADDHLDWRDIADVLWLANQLPSEERPTGSLTASSEGRATPANTPEVVPAREGEAPSPTTPQAPESVSRPLTLGRSAVVSGDAANLELAVPAGYALPGRLEIGRALRPFKQLRRSRIAQVFDVAATVDHYCATRLLVPISSAAKERWFQDIALVTDGGPSMVPWAETIDALAELLAHHGAFSRVSRWTLAGGPDEVELHTPGGLRHDPSALTAFDARRLVLVITDCVGPMWRGDGAWAALREWGRFTPVAIVHTLPVRLWPSTALGDADVLITARSPGEPNAQLQVSEPWWWDEDDPPRHAIPVVTLDERRLRSWAQMVMGREGPGVEAVIADALDRREAEAPADPVDPRARVASFRATVSESAARLATLLSAIDVTLPVARLVLARLIPDGRQVHLAELLASGLLRASDADGNSYDFAPGVREVLQASLTASDTFDVWRSVAPYLEKLTGDRTPFSALLDAGADAQTDVAGSSVARIAAALIDRLQLGPAARAPEPDRSGTAAPEPVLGAAETGVDAEVPEAMASAPPSVETLEDGVITVALASVDGRQVIVSAGSDGTWRTWDLETGAQLLGPTLAHPSGVAALATSQISEGPIALTGGPDEELRIWDLASGHQLWVSLPAPTGGVTALAATGVSYQPIACAGAADGTLQLWLLDGGSPLAGPVPAHRGRVTAVAVSALASVPVAVSAGADGALRVWDAYSGKLMSELATEGTELPTAVAAGDVGNATVAVAGDDGGRLTVWDLARGAVLAGPVPLHEGPVTGLAIADARNGAAMVSAGRDGKIAVSMWLPSGVMANPLMISAMGARTVAVGAIRSAAVIVCGLSDGTVSVWDLLTGAPLGAPMVHLSATVPVSVQPARAQAPDPSSSDTTPLPSVFISYRRDDADGYAQRLRMRLAEPYGSENVFLDMAGPHPYSVWSDSIQERGDQVGVVLALIGPRWVSILHERAGGDLDDYVRRELELALARGAASIVIPILVGGATFPDPETLPRSLQALTRIQAAQLRDDSWDTDVDYLITEIDRIAEDRRPLASGPEGEPDSSASGPTAAPAITEPEPLSAEILEALVRGTVVLFLGSRANSAGRTSARTPDSRQLPDGDELARALAEQGRIEDAGRELAEIAQQLYVDRGPAMLATILRALLPVDAEPGALHRLIAGLPARLGRSGGRTPYQLLLTVNYDVALERAFDEAREPYDLVVFTTEESRFVHFPWQTEPVLINEPNSYIGLPIRDDGDLDRTVIVKTHGSVDAPGEQYRKRDNFVITQDQHIDYSDTTLPLQIRDKLAMSSSLILGGTVRDQRLRVLLRRLWGSQTRERAWAVQKDVDDFERRSWQGMSVLPDAADPAEFLQQLEYRLPAVG